MKSFYSCLDLGCGNILTQAMQHTINGKMASDRGGKVIFYTAEDTDTLGQQSVIRSKISEQPPIDGIVYLRLHQFSYSGEFDFEFLSELLKKGYEVHFAREKISIVDQSQLDEMYETLKAFDYLALNQQEEICRQLASMLPQ